ncbi:MAG: 4Fe-4S binding protein [Alphaproteobacteria bacterium]|nr:4Fe-4S binding protein [Alphaproteobacteria bacterium]
MKVSLNKIKLILATLSMLLSIMAFSAVGIYVFKWTQIQLAPNIIKLVTAFSLSSLAIFLSILLFTFIFGRIYCSFICPLGILQDLIGCFIPGKIKTIRNYRGLRYGIFITCVMLLLGGSAIGFALLDPYSGFGRISTGTIIPTLISIHNMMVPYGIITQPLDSLWIIFGAILPLILLVCLVIWKKRIFCTTICPIGTLLGLCSKKGLVQLEIDEDKCLSCMQCIKKCPVGCISIERKNIDNERCVRCMGCISICPRNAIGFKITGAMKRKEKDGNEIDLSKRNILFGGLLAACALGSGKIIKNSVKFNQTDDAIILPPGAGSRKKFLSKCTNCNLCVMGCRGKVLRPATLGKPLVHMNFKRGVCEFKCKYCMKVCPTGALTNMPIKDKQRLQIGLAHLDLSNCITVTAKTDCGACSEVCPVGALYMIEQPDGTRIPHLNPDLCIGCGSCEYACPVNPKPIVVKAVPDQVLIDIPKNENESEEKIPVNTDEWLF